MEYKYYIDCIGSKDFTLYVSNLENAMIVMEQLSKMYDNVLLVDASTGEIICEVIR